MPYTILIVDEEAVAALTLATVFESAGYRPLRASTVQQASQLVSTHALDAIILDDHVEGAHRFGRSVKQLRPPLPVLIFSSVPDDPDASSYADAFAAKPEDPRRLLQRVATLISNTHQYRDRARAA